MSGRALALAWLSASAALAGCLADDSGPRGLDAPAFAAGVHPWPRGDEWPLDPARLFEVKEVLHLPVPTFDETVLDGWVVLPTAVDEADVPVVLWTAPYFGQCAYYPPPTSAQGAQGYPYCSYATGDDPALWDNDLISEAVPVRFLVEHGYAVAIFNVRGTGNSGGCFEWFGPNEQRDQAWLVEWLAAQEWSNRRVGMMGLSYHGTTPWEAAIQNPPSLKTIVVAGMISDAYTFSHTPQGATFSTIGLFEPQFAVRVSLSPPVKGGAEHATARHLGVADERLCPELARAVSDDALGTFRDERDAAFWTARRLIDGFPRVTASVFLTHGFQDLWYSGHQAQERDAWGALPLAPKRMLEGQWGHQFPNFNTFNPDWALTDWNERLLAWLDFWLKGLGEPPRLGLVDYQDGLGAWHESTGWPPADARQEVLHLAAGALSPAPGTGSASFRSAPALDSGLELESGPPEVLCPDLEARPLGPLGLVYTTLPVEQPVLLAGNPFAYLTLGSDQRGGLVAVHLYDLGPEFDCVGGRPRDARRLAVGVADLRFHAGGYLGKDFPLDSPTAVRIDITNLAEVLEPGHRLAAVVSRGDPIDRNGQPFAPRITVHETGDGASHLVLPLVAGTFGGAAPSLDYPPRPFLPALG